MKMSMMYYKLTGTYHSATSLNNHFARQAKRYEIPGFIKHNETIDYEKILMCPSLELLQIDNLLNKI